MTPKAPFFGGLFLFLSVISYMANFGDQILGVSYQASTDAIDPGTSTGSNGETITNSLYITALVNKGATARAVVVSSGNDLGIAASAAVNFNPPIKLAAGATATAAHADVVIGYFVA